MERAPFHAPGTGEGAPGAAVRAPGGESRAGGAGLRPSAGAAAPEDLVVLLGRIVAGEQAALGELYDSTVTKLYGLARLIVRNTQDAEEVICDAYAQVWRSADRYDASRGSVLAWLLMICRSRALDLRRRNELDRRSRSAGAPDEESGTTPGIGPQELLNALEQHAALHGAIAKLSPVRRRLVWLAFFEGLSHEDIVRATCLPLGTVKSHIRRALASLRAELDRGRNGETAQ